MEITVHTVLGTYECRSFTNVDPDETGIDISKNGESIGSMIEVSLPDEMDVDEMDDFVDKLEVWLCENE